MILGGLAAPRMSLARYQVIPRAKNNVCFSLPTTDIGRLPAKRCFAPKAAPGRFEIQFPLYPAELKTDIAPCLNSANRRLMHATILGFDRLSDPLNAGLGFTKRSCRAKRSHQAKKLLPNGERQK